MARGQLQQQREIYALQQQQVLNVKAAPFNAAGNGVRDDTTAVQGAIAALGATGGALYFPKGTYRYSTPLNLESYTSTVLTGAAGITAGTTPAATLLYTGTTSPAINARSTEGVCFQDLCLAYNNSGFTGDVLDFSHGASGFDSAYSNLTRCLFLGFGPTTTARSFLYLDKATRGKFDKVAFNEGAASHVLGRLTDDTHYAISMGFSDCSFQNAGTVPLRNPGEAWTITNCTFEPTLTGDAAGVSWDAGFVSKSFTLNGCWFGDVVSGLGTWIAVGGGACGGMDIRGNYFGLGANAITFTGANTKGVCIMANKFDFQGTSGITFNAAGQSDFDVFANDFSTVSSTAIIKTTTPSNSRFQV